MNGWQLVPVEPTYEMEFAWNNGKTSTYRRFRERWINALAPAPTPDEDEIGIPQPEPELVKAAEDVMFVIKSWQENRTITFVPSEERIFQRFFNALDKVKS